MNKSDSDTSEIDETLKRVFNFLVKTRFHFPKRRCRHLTKQRQSPCSFVLLFGVFFFLRVRYNKFFHLKFDHGSSIFFFVKLQCHDTWGFTKWKWKFRCLFFSPLNLMQKSGAWRTTYHVRRLGVLRRAGRSAGSVENRIHHQSR